MNFSFFYPQTKKAISAEIRGRQIAPRLNGKMNPVDGYEDDICIYVKCVPPDNFPDNTFVDIVDSKTLVNWVQRRPRAKAIAISKTAQNYLFRKLNRNIYLIPEHHCNFDNEIRTNTKIKTVGYMGCRTGSKFPEDMAEQFAEIGLAFIYTREYRTRQDVIDFYKTIDIQVMDKYVRHKAIVNLKNPLKLANAGSFKIPTVAYPEENFIEEFGGCFVESKTISEMVKQCKLLKEDNVFYQETAEKAFIRAQNYHIDKIIPLYRELNGSLL